MNKLETRHFDLEIIAGPCSMSGEGRNLSSIYNIAQISLHNGEPAISGTRVVGIKSRTEDNITGNGMGIDYDFLERAIEGELIEGEIPRSVLDAERIQRETNLLIASEIMLPEIQMPHYIGRIPEGKGMFWNPAVMQLGFPIRQMAKYAAEHGWYIGIKNGKTLGTTLAQANNPDSPETPMEKTWSGLATFTRGVDGRIILIHRGVEVPEKGNFRSAIVHESAKRVKNKIPHARLFFDPSHSLGPKLRDSIVETTVEAMQMRNGADFLYDGILIETGESETDTGQHITVEELSDMVKDLQRFRRLKTRETSEMVYAYA